MGLTETFNSDLTPKTSNNIDVHMMRSTEYGAIAILSASAYGNPSNAQNLTTTSGNNTGVMMKHRSTTEDLENVAGVRELSGVNSRYFDKYTTNMSSAKTGDALGNASTSNPGCSGWHTGASGSWFTNNSSDSYMVRGGWGIFYYDTIAPSYSFASRGVAVCGQGF